MGYPFLLHIGIDKNTSVTSKFRDIIVSILHLDVYPFFMNITQSGNDSFQMKR